MHEDIIESCFSKGLILKQERINKNKALLMIENAKINISAAEILINSISKKDKEWICVYNHYYDAIRIYIEVFLSFNNIKIINHKCLFSYLYYKFPQLDFDFNFFELIRTKRNGINYYGGSILYKDWKKIEIQMTLYLKLLENLIKNKLQTL